MGLNLYENHFPIDGYFKVFLNNTLVTLKKI